MMVTFHDMVILKFKKVQTTGWFRSFPRPCRMQVTNLNSQVIALVH